MYKTFAPKLNGRYLSSNVNITVLDKFGKSVSVPVGGMYTPRHTAQLLTVLGRALREVQDSQVRPSLSLILTSALTILAQGT